MTGSSQPDPSREGIKAWRAARRAELLARRVAAPPEQREAWGKCITRHLIAGFDIPGDSVAACCWPYQGEFDARFAMSVWRKSGVQTALPEVVAPRTALQFRKWWPGAPMRPGVYDIPVPDGTDIVMPDIAIVPMTGFDERGFRLGYGGGFFDRTLAACEQRILAIGVSYEMSRLPTIHPQPHDIPMDFVVTEAGICAAAGALLTPLDYAASRALAKRLLQERRLPRAAFAVAGYSSPVCYGSEFPGYWGEKGSEQ